MQAPYTTHVDPNGAGSFNEGKNTHFFKGLRQTRTLSLFETLRHLKSNDKIRSFHAFRMRFFNLDEHVQILYMQNIYILYF